MRHPAAIGCPVLSRSQAGISRIDDLSRRKAKADSSRH
jgi:hypothetical protein